MSFAQETLGLRLHPGQREILEAFESGDYRQLLLNVGRRSGKSLISDILALGDATMRDEELRPYLRKGEARIIAVVATKELQAAEHLRNLSAMIRGSELLRSYLVRENKNEIVLANGSIIRVYPCSARALRGIACSSVILDEFGHFEEVENSQATGKEILRSVRPSLVQFGGKGWLIVISTPDWRNTEFGRMVTRAERSRPDWLLYFHRTTAQMRPDMLGELEKERQDDPEAFAQEFEAVFKDTSGAYLSSEDVLTCVRSGSRILPPRDGVRYVGAIDPAFSVDRFAMAIGHKDASDGRVIIDGVWTWHAQGFKPTMGGVAQVAEEYHIQELLTDQHAVEAIREALDEHRIYSNYKPWTSDTKANAFGRLKLGVNARRVELPDDPGLVAELCSLEAKPTPAGFTRIAARTGHDDRAVVVASVVNALDRPDSVVAIFATSDEAWQESVREPAVFSGVQEMDKDGDQAWPSGWMR